MKVNTKKSSVMKICKSRTKTFPIEIEIDGNLLEVKKEMKILGVILQKGMQEHVGDMKNEDIGYGLFYFNALLFKRSKISPGTRCDYLAKRAHFETFC